MCVLEINKFEKTAKKKKTVSAQRKLHVKIVFAKLFPPKACMCMAGDVAEVTRITVRV